MNEPKESKRKLTKYGLIFLGMVIVLCIVVAQIPPTKPKYEPVNKLKQNVAQAQADVVLIQDMVAHQCKYPLTAEVPFTQMSFTNYPADSSIVIVAGKGNAKNAFGVPSEFEYLLWLQIRDNDRDSIAYFRMEKL